MQTGGQMLLCCWQASALSRQLCWSEAWFAALCTGLHNSSWLSFGLVQAQACAMCVDARACSDNCTKVANWALSVALLNTCPCCCRRFVTAGAAVEAVGQRGLTSKTQIEVIARSFNWLVWLLAALDMLKEAEVGGPPGGLILHLCT